MDNWNPKFAIVCLALFSLGVIVLVPVGWVVFYFGIYLGFGNYQVRGHQEFAANGLAQIDVASEMNHLFDDCRHRITYAGRDSTPMWSSDAYFGGRYWLSMQIPVMIESNVKGKAIGDPKFYLREVRDVSITHSGQVATSFSNQIEFGPAQWKDVVEAGGDFSAIGFKLKSGPPVKGFDILSERAR